MKIQVSEPKKLLVPFGFITGFVLVSVIAHGIELALIVYLFIKLGGLVQ
jgi:hypothetical protein